MSTAILNLRAAYERAAAVRPPVGGFPYLAEALRQARVTGYRVTVPSMTTVYASPDGAVTVLGDPLITGTADVPPYDEARFVASLRASQAGGTTYPEFVRGCWEAGVVSYDVDLAARTCTYHGADGDNYTEVYPAVEI
ncbi:DUF1398 family protein [Streptomyces sp. NPDC091281]|uniref:DUF1398 family protein n=1 Tax=Streptomyces sp. NPDC091281 TaxID=3365985 RepID=UPI003812903B